MKATHIELRCTRRCGGDGFNPCGRPATHEVWVHPGNRQMGPWCYGDAKLHAHRLAKAEGVPAERTDVRA